MLQYLYNYTRFFKNNFYLDFFLKKFILYFLNNLILKLNLFFTTKFSIETFLSSNKQLFQIFNDFSNLFKVMSLQLLLRYSLGFFLFLFFSVCVYSVNV